MKPEKIKKIFEIFQRNDPEPETELKFKNEFTLLVAIALSAQSTDVAVNKATESLFKIADDPEKMLALGEEKLKTYIKTIGLFNSKAKNIILLSEKLIKEHGGKVPDEFEKLIELPGVGIKTANVFLNCFHKVPVIAVDTHVFRVSNRTGLVKTTTAEETAEKLNKVVPAEFKLHAHHWLILHGRYVCKARRPECGRCIINDLCEYKNKEF
jgi:endonuclease-3